MTPGKLFAMLDRGGESVLPPRLFAAWLACNFFQALSISPEAKDEVAFPKQLVVNARV